jgi:hypothetical protein
VEVSTWRFSYEYGQKQQYSQHAFYQRRQRPCGRRLSHGDFHFIQSDVLCLADNGFMHFYDYKTGYKFQEFRTPPQSGSLESEAGIYAVYYYCYYYYYLVVFLIFFQPLYAKVKEVNFY